MAEKYEYEDVLRRVKKLEALAEHAKTSPSEAALARKQAEALRRRYDIPRFAPPKLKDLGIAIGIKVGPFTITLFRR